MPASNINYPQSYHHREPTSPEYHFQQPPQPTVKYIPTLIELELKFEKLQAEVARMYDRQVIHTGLLFRIHADLGRLMRHFGEEPTSDASEPSK